MTVSFKLFFQNELEGEGSYQNALRKRIVLKQCTDSEPIPRTADAGTHTFAIYHTPNDRHYFPDRTYWCKHVADTPYTIVISKIDNRTTLQMERDPLAGIEVPAVVTNVTSPVSYLVQDK